MIPEDIERKVAELFQNFDEQNEAKKLLTTLWAIQLNVGAAQLARSVLTISGSEIDKLKLVFESNFYGDPRDTIMMAERLLGNPSHYFIPTFDEIENK